MLSVLTPAGLGETCEGFNEATGLPFPSCASGLKCGEKSATRTSLPGAERKCIDPHAMMPDTEEAPHEPFDPKKYPFLSIEFPFADPEHVVTEHAETHYYAEPEECKPCADLKEKVSELEDKVEGLEEDLAQEQVRAREAESSTPSYLRNRYLWRYR